MIGTPEIVAFVDVEEAPASGSRHIGIQGLRGESRQTLRALAGEIIELPAFTIRIADEDLD